MEAVDIKGIPGVEDMPDMDKPKGKGKVGRPGVTYDRVAQACLAVRAAGQNVTTDRVRAVMGTGSTGTVHPMVKRWNDENPLTKAVSTPTLPDALLRDIGKELDRITAAAKSEARQELQDATEAADKYAAEIRTLEAENDALDKQVEQLTEERNQALTLSQEQDVELRRLRESMLAEQISAEHTRVELAKAQLKAEAEAVRVKEQAQEIIRLRGELAAEGAGRQKAEKDLVEAKAQLQATLDSKAEALEREKAAVARELEMAKESKATIGAARSDAAAQVSTVKAEAERLISEVKDSAAASADKAKERISLLEQALHDERLKTQAAEAKSNILEAQIADMKPRLDRAEAGLTKARETYESLAGEGRIVIPKSKKSGGVQASDRPAG